MKNKKLRIAIPSAALIVTAALISLYVYTNDNEDFTADNDKQLFSFETHWSQGDVVALIRHTERCDRSDNVCLEGDTGITVSGKNKAVEVGQAYGRLLTPQTTIYNSPVKRTIQSAKFMFGPRSITKTWLREGCKEHLLDNILKYKEEDKNLILVTHSTCIDALGEEQGNDLFDMSLHGEETYGGSFFIAIDSARKLAYSLGYLDSESLQNYHFNP